MTARALRRAALPLVLVVTAAGCGGSKTVALKGTSSGTVGPGSAPASSDAATTAPAAASTTTAPAAPGSAGVNPSTSPRPGVTLPPAVTATTAAGAATTATTTATTAAPARPGPPASTAAGGAPAPAAPGTYQVKQSGSFTAAGSTSQYPPTGTIVVDPADSGGTQVSHRFVQQGKEASGTTVAFRASGPVITSTSQQGPGGSIVCTFSPAIPAPPQPPTVGASFASTGACGQFSTAVKGSITGTKTVTLDGTSYPAVVIDSTLTLSGAVSGNGTEEDWYVPALRLVAHQTMTLDGKYGAFPFSSSLTTDLTTARPS